MVGHNQDAGYARRESRYRVVPEPLSLTCSLGLPAVTLKDWTGSLGVGEAREMWSGEGLVSVSSAVALHSSRRIEFGGGWDDGDGSVRVR